MSSKTALDIDPSKWDQYQPFAPDAKEKSFTSLAQEARGVAKKIARELIRRFGAKKVVLFGSLARGNFRSCSDIDLAVWGIPATDFFRAVAFACGISDVWKVDLVDAQDCTRALREIILEEGTDL
jgi:predicted nucleotidyltransferase